MTLRIGYAKIGRSLGFDPTKFGYQGDAEAPQLLYRLARRNPNVEWVVVGRNDGTTEFPCPNVTNAWISPDGKLRTGASPGYADKLSVVIGTLDGFVMHGGQTGTSHFSIPQSTSTWAQYYADPWTHATTPQDWATTYASFLIKGLNVLGDRTDGRAPVVWLITDPRNYAKARDVKWPTGMDSILSQYAYDRDQRHERWRDPRTPDQLTPYAGWCRPDRDGEVWVARHRYVYGGLELMILPDDWSNWGAPPFHDREPVGVATTSFKDAVSGGGTEPRRSELVRDWVWSAFPDARVCGKWDKGSRLDVPSGYDVEETDPNQFVDLLESWRVTLAMPALGSSWTTAKPYQCWAARTICFMLGRLDDQGWTLPTTSPRNAGGAALTQVADDLWSIRDDWTSDDLNLARWLRVATPDEFVVRAKTASEDEGTWTWLVGAQRTLLQRRWDERRVENEIERRLGLHRDDIQA